MASLVSAQPLEAGKEGTPSLWLTQAERGFLRIFCHTIWALASVAALLVWTHLAATVQTDICSLLPPVE